MVPFGIYLISCSSYKGVTVFNTPPKVDVVSLYNGDEFLYVDSDTMHLYRLDEGNGIMIYDLIDPTMSGIIV